MAEKTAQSYRKDIIWIILIGVCVRILFTLFFLGSGFSMKDARQVYPDSATYIAPADSMLETGRFLNIDGAPEIHRTPGYPLFLAFCKLILGENWTPFTIMLQLLLNLMAVLLVHAVLHEIGVGRRGVFGGAMLAALNLHDVYFCFFILSDILFQFLILAAFFLLLRFLKTAHFRPLIGAALLFAMGMFVRPSGLYLPVLLSLILFGLFLLKRDWQWGMKLSALFLSVSLAPALLWCYRNESVSGFAGFSATQSSNLYAYHSAGVLAFVNGTDFYQEQEALGRNPELTALRDGMTLQQAETMLAKQILTQHLPVYALLMLEGAGLILLYPGIFDVFRLNDAFAIYLSGVRAIFLNGESLLSRAVEIIFQPFSLLAGLNFLILLALLIGTVSGMVRSVRGAIPRVIEIMLCAAFLYFLLVSAGPNGYGTYPRFRLSLSLFQAIFCGIAIAAWL